MVLTKQQKMEMDIELKVSSNLCKKELTTLE